jgi:hypothetical protein
LKHIRSLSRSQHHHHHPSPSHTHTHTPHQQVVSKDIRRILAERERYFNIILEDVSITPPIKPHIHLNHQEPGCAQQKWALALVNTHSFSHSPPLPCQNTRTGCVKGHSPHPG